MVYRILHGFGLGALLEDRLQQRDGQFGELLVGRSLHVVGDDADVEFGIGIVLSEEGVDGMDDDPVFVVGGVEDEERVIVGGLLAFFAPCQISSQRRCLLFPQHGDQCKEEDIGSRGCQQQPEQDFNHMNYLPDHNIS